MLCSSYSKAGSRQNTTKRWATSELASSSACATTSKFLATCSLKADHDKTQRTLDEKLEKYRNKTYALTRLHEDATYKDREWNGCITREKQLLEDYENCGLQEATLRVMRAEACAQRDGLQEFNRTQRPAANFNCLFPDDGLCTENLQEWSDNVMMALLKARDAYKAASENCTLEKDKHAAKEVECRSKQTAWVNKRNDCNVVLSERQVEMCRVATAWTTKCEAKRAFDQLVIETNETDGSDFSEPDRIKEMAHLEMLECILRRGLDGYGALEAIHTQCPYSTVESETQLSLDRNLSAYADLTRPEQFTCQEDRLMFSGLSWTMPASTTGARSSEYVQSRNHTVRLNTSGSFARFPFCHARRVNCESFECVSETTRTRNRCHLGSGCTAFECCNGPLELQPLDAQLGTDLRISATDNHAPATDMIGSKEGPSLPRTSVAAIEPDGDAPADASMQEALLEAPESSFNAAGSDGGALGEDRAGEGASYRPRP